MTGFDRRATRSPHGTARQESLEYQLARGRARQTLWSAPAQSQVSQLRQAYHLCVCHCRNNGRFARLHSVQRRLICSNHYQQTTECVRIPVNLARWHCFPRQMRPFVAHCLHFLYPGPAFAGQVCRVGKFTPTLVEYPQQRRKVELLESIMAASVHDPVVAEELAELHVSPPVR